MGKHERQARRRLAGVICSVALGGAAVLSGCGADMADGADPATPSAAELPAPAITGPSDEATTTTAPPPCTAAGAIAEWPLRRRIAQLLVAPLPESDPARAAALVGLFQPGGVFLAHATSATDGTLQQVLAGVGPVPALVAVDEEGGRVQRLDEEVGAIPSARQMAASMNARQVRRLGARVGRSLAAIGVNTDLAPVVDVSRQADDEVIGDRSFSSDAAVVTTYAGAFAEGLRSAGVLPVLKHFPGHGRASGDSHQGPVVTPPIAELLRSDVRPYETLLREQPVAVMMGHLDVPGLTEPGRPSSLSPAAVSLLRDDLGFDGLVMTDDLGGMRAVASRFDLPEAAVLALAAGVDMVLWNTADRLPELVTGIENAVAGGSLPESRINESVERVLDAKGVDACDVDLP